MFQDSLNQDLADDRKKAEDQAQGLLQHLAVNDPVDIYKAICSIKCAEVLTRAFDTTAYPGMVEIVATFVETTMKAVDGNAGSRSEGIAILKVLESIAPFKSAPTAQEFAIRMHMFDTMILDAAKRLGVEATAKASIDAMTRDIFIFLLKDTAVAPNNSEVN